MKTTSWLKVNIMSRVLNSTHEYCCSPLNTIVYFVLPVGASTGDGGALTLPLGVLIAIIIGIALIIGVLILTVGLVCLKR